MEGVRSRENETTTTVQGVYDVARITNQRPADLGTNSGDLVKTLGMLISCRTRSGVKEDNGLAEQYKSRGKRINEINREEDIHVSILGHCEQQEQHKRPVERGKSLIVEVMVESMPIELDTGTACSLITALCPLSFIPLQHMKTSLRTYIG